MEKKTLNARELGQIKRIAMNVDADYQKVLKLEAKISELTKEKNNIQNDIDEMEAPVIRKTGGYRSTDIYKKVIIPQFNEDGTPKTDKEGRQLKITKYILRYEDSILPPIVNDQCPTDEEPVPESINTDTSNVNNSLESGSSNPVFGVY